MTSKPHTETSRRQFLRRSGATLTAAGTVGLVATTQPGAASSTEAGVFGGGFEPEPDYASFLSGYVNRYSSNILAPDDVETLADSARTEFEANEEYWLSYGNWLFEETGVEPIGSADIAVDWRLTRGRWPTRSESVSTTISVEFDADAGEFNAVEWTLEETDDPDYELEIQNRAAEKATEELARFRRTWIGESDADHAMPSDEYLNELAGEYWHAIGFGSASKSVLELLLGEIK